MPTKSSNSTTQYTQNELPYLYCNVCGRKDYRIVGAGQVCQVYNSSPSKYPQKNCPGIMTQATNTIATLSNNQSNDERSSS
jgi:hypothetical protein